MDDQSEKETKGVPWGDHNETPSTPPDTRREEYGDRDPSQGADERVQHAGEHSADASEEQADGDGSNADDEQPGAPEAKRAPWGDAPIHD